MCIQIFYMINLIFYSNRASTLALSDACLSAFCGKFVNTLLDPVSSEFLSARETFESTSVPSTFELRVSFTSLMTSLLMSPIISLTSFLTLSVTSLLVTSLSVASFFTSSPPLSITPSCLLSSSVIWNGFLPDGNSLVSFAHLDGGQMILVATPLTRPSGT
jgi:hypothetical protein